MSAPKRTFQPQFDSLEDRSLMASGLTATFTQGALTIMGTSSSDRIHIREQGTKITVDGFTGSIASSQIRSIKIDAGYGEDAITLSLSKTMAAKTNVMGGAGTDSLVASSSALPMYYSSLERYLDSGRMTSERSAVDSVFANLRGEFEVQSGSTTKFNCIAWSLGVTSTWINPPKTLAACDQLNAKYGYKRMTSPTLTLEKGYEKVVLYGKKDARGNITEFTHQARQLKDGTWTSKLGGMSTIRHVTPYTLDGNTYGVPIYVYIRPNSAF